MSEEGTYVDTQDEYYADADLVYAAYSRCRCGAGLAYYKGADYWDCSDILTGRFVPKGKPGAASHTDKLFFIFWNIRSEAQPSAAGQTTRPQFYDIVVGKEPTS